jgi:DNA-binding IclR family transcriptional regulator
MGNRTYTLQTLRKGLEVLEAFERGTPELTLTELSARLRESQSVVFRLLKTLEERGYVQRDPVSKRYSLGLRIWELGCQSVRRTGLTEVARPVLKWLTEVTGETSYLAVVQGTDIIYIDIVEGLEPLRVYAEPGFRVPLYLTASGKAILAFRGPDLFRHVVMTGLKRLTPATITSVVRLRARLEEIRRTGLSFNLGERRPDISAVAAPIFDRLDACIAAIGVSGPSVRFTDDRVSKLTESVRKAAQEISAKLGHLGTGRSAAR